MAPVRIRHPNGVATIQAALDRDDFTVQDLQQEIYSATQIIPSRQRLKAGYPPRDLALIPELPVSSLGLASGEQIIVSETAGPSGGAAPSQAASAAVPASTPASAPSAAVMPPSSNGPAHVEMADGSFFIHRVVPDDNSCMFSAISLIFKQSISEAQEIRKLVADGIRTDPVTYNEAILGMDPDKYIATILKPATWGGAIELSVLAKHFGVEISSVDVETGRVDHFTPGEASGDTRCVLVYSGIHYDAASVSPMLEAPNEWHQTVFPIRSQLDESDEVIGAAKKLADILRAKRAYTNTATFDLKCENCGQGLKGEKDARAHAAQTGHTNFGEY
ncbi:hypothetical protein BD626DRAFT_548466 [Schizophyllum amplum]|uniref:Ubiquitin thioesterase OTU n=1 Tax=Schizophyllum amplum TaxID=97359 RepID=A0A550CCS4_9AGAR|nr:hypothetical protein BD626DRAFT_548466 [Auriculariopsis ampla]